MCERYNSRSAKARFVMSEGSMKENAQFVQSLLDEGVKIIDHKVMYSGDGASDTYAVSVLYVPNYFTVEEYEATSSETAETTDGAPTTEPEVSSENSYMLRRLEEKEAKRREAGFAPKAEPDVTADAALVTTAESEDVAKDTIDGLQKQADADEAEKADEADERR